MLNSLLVLHLWDVNHPCIAFTHHLHGFQISDLHCWFRLKLFSSLPHKLRWLHISFGRNYLTLSKPSLFCSTGKGILEIFGELNILNKNFLHISTPFLHILINLLLYIICNFLSFLKKILQNELATCIFENSISNLSDSGLDVLDSIVSKSSSHNSIIDSCINIDWNIVFGNDILHGVMGTCLAKSITLILIFIWFKVSVHGLI